MTTVRVDFAWQPVGPLVLEGRRPVFPQLPETPGLYRFTFEWRGRARGVYIGETDGLRRRAQHYRTPGPTQPTNVRINGEIVAALEARVTVSVSVITRAAISVDGRPPRDLDLSRKTSRQIVENAAMAEVIAEHEADPAHGPVLMNRPGVGEAEWS